jgi:hypothetical protein
LATRLSALCEPSQSITPPFTANKTYSFCRNVFSVIVLFVLTPWVNGMGIQNLHILTACILFAVLLLPLGLLKWGKGFRVRTAEKYKEMAGRQPTSRTFL